jgi:hypothetical protein
MTWQDTLSERLAANIASMDYQTDEQQASLLELELERVILATEAGQPLGTEPDKSKVDASTEDDLEEPTEETDKPKKAKVELLKDTFAPGGWPPVRKN